MKRILINGATGLVGSNFATYRKSFEVVGMARHRPIWWPNERKFYECDVFDSRGKWLDSLPGLDAVVFLAFPVNIDEVESYVPEQCDKITAGFAKWAEECQRRGIPIMFISSDAVVWGNSVAERQSNCSANPLNKYGSLKLACEMILQSRVDTHGSCAVRCTPVGYHSFAEAHGLLGSMHSKAKLGKVKGFTNSYISPVSCHQLVDFVDGWLKVVGSNAPVPRVIHLASVDCISKYELIKKSLATNGMENRIEEASLDPSLFKVPRVNNQCLIPTDLVWHRSYKASDVIASL